MVWVGAQLVPAHVKHHHSAGDRAINKRIRHPVRVQDRITICSPAMRDYECAVSVCCCCSVPQPALARSPPVDLCPEAASLFRRKASRALVKLATRAVLRLSVIVRPPRADISLCVRFDIRFHGSSVPHKPACVKPRSPFHPQPCKRECLPWRVASNAGQRKQGTPMP